MNCMFRTQNSDVCLPNVSVLCDRFCGPASTVKVYCVTSPHLEIRTLGDAVSETGERMVQFALFPEQLALLEVIFYLSQCWTSTASNTEFYRSHKAENG